MYDMCVTFLPTVLTRARLFVGFYKEAELRLLARRLTLTSLRQLNVLESFYKRLCGNNRERPVGVAAAAAARCVGMWDVVVKLVDGLLGLGPFEAGLDWT